MIRQPILAAIVVALSFAPALADEPEALESRLALVEAVAKTHSIVGSIVGSEGPAGLLPLEEITFDTEMAPYFHPDVPRELRYAALRRMWQVHPGVNRAGSTLSSTQ